MIKINFVRERKKKKPVFRLNWLKVYIFLLVLAFISVVFSFLFVQKELHNKIREKKTLEQEKARYIIIVKKIEKLKKEDAELKNRIQTVLNLKKNRGRLLRIFDEIVRPIPIGKMYLVSISLFNNKATVSGFALDYENVAVYLKSLNRSKLFRRTDLLYTKQKEIKGYNLVEFRINLEF